MKDHKESLHLILFQREICMFVKSSRRWDILFLHYLMLNHNTPPPHTTAHHPVRPCPHRWCLGGQPGQHPLADWPHPQMLPPPHRADQMQTPKGPWKSAEKTKIHWSCSLRLNHGTLPCCLQFFVSQPPYFKRNVNKNPQGIHTWRISYLKLLQKPGGGDNTTLLLSVNITALGMFCCAKYAHHRFTSAIKVKTSLNYSNSKYWR